jgi:hypothetical protein
VVAIGDGLVITIMLGTFAPESGSGSQRASVLAKVKPGADNCSPSREASTIGDAGFGADLGSALSVEPGSAVALTSVSFSGVVGMARG